MAKNKKGRKLNYYTSALIYQITSVITGVLSSAMISRYLGVEIKGQYAYISNLLSMGVIILGLGIFQTYPALKRKGAKKCLDMYLNLYIIQFIIYFLVFTGISLILKIPSLIIAAFILPFQILSTQIHYIFLAEDIRTYQLLNFILLFVNLCSVALTYLFLPTNLIIIFAILLLKDIIIIVYDLRKLNFQLNFKLIDGGQLTVIFKIGLIGMITSLLVNINYKVDILILKYYWTDYEIGLYSTAAGLVNYIWLVPNAFKGIIFSKNAKTDAIEDILFSIKASMLFALTSGLLVFLFGNTVISILYGSDFIPCIKIVYLLFLGIPSMIFYKLTDSLYLANGKIKFYFITLFISAVLNVFLNLMLIPTYSNSGAALASVLSYNVCGLSFIIKFMYDYKISLPKLLFIKKCDLQYMFTSIKNKRDE